MLIDLSEYDALFREAEARREHVITLIGEIMQAAQVNAEAAISGIEAIMVAEPSVVSRKMLPAALIFLREMKKQPGRFGEYKRENPADQGRAYALTRQAAQELCKAVEVHDASLFVKFLSAKAGVDFHALGQAWASATGKSDLPEDSPDDPDGSVSGGVS